MKKFPGFVRFTSNPFRQKWIQGGAVFLTAVALSAGCGKKSEQTSAPPPQTSADATSQPAATPANPTVNQTQAPSQTGQAANPTTATAPATAAPDLSALNRSLRSWIMSNRRAPKSFDDFAASSGVTIPPAPPGKKYVLTGNMHIQLVNQ